MDALKEWVEHHMTDKTSDDLWYLAEEILTELSKRDSVEYRIKELEPLTHDSEGCQTMAPKMYTSGSGELILSKPKKTSQGYGKHTKYSATSRNSTKKRYRGQGR